MHNFNDAGHPLSGGGIERLDRPPWFGGTLQQRHQHARERNVDGELRGTVSLSRNVDARQLQSATPPISQILGVPSSAARPPGVSPIFLQLALNGRRRRIFDLKPIVNAAGAIGRAEAFGDDTLASQGAGVLKDDGAVAIEMFVEGNAVIRFAEKVCQRALTIFQPRATEVLTIKLDQIEGAEHGGVIVLTITQSIEDREAASVDHYGLAVEQARMDAETSDDRSDLGEPRREIVAVAREQAHVLGLAPRHDAEAVVLDLMNPVGSRGAAPPSDGAGMVL
jgi:hypothetical protein